ncbi:MAG: TolC family protein [Gammaproteobacteria bacterium]|nr:TolC family protein [Pseudomonadales bacterium]MCP5347806.1 TolC family protein [Pseudomonadales bacterium]
MSLKAHPQVNRLILLGVLLSCSLRGYSQPGSTTPEMQFDSLGITNELGFTLEDFFTSAIDFSPELQIAREQLQIGSARKRAATGRLLPQLNANASLSDNDRTSAQDDQRYTGERYNVQLSQILFDWQQFASRKQASYLENQREAEYYVRLGELLTEVAGRYFDVLQAEDALTSIRTELNAVTTQLNLVENYYQRQLAQITDLYDAQAQLAAVQAEELALESELQLAREALRSRSGITPGALHRLGEEVAIPALEENLSYWVEQGLQNNQLILASESAQQAAKQGVSARRGAYLPTVNLIVQQQNSNLGFDNAPLLKTDTTYVGVNVSIPLYAGGSNRAAVREAQSLENIAENELRLTQLGVNERIRAAFLQVRASEARTEAARRLVESTALSAEARARGFELGTVNSVDMLNSLRDQFQAERDFQRTRYEHIKMLLELKRETGTLTGDDLLEVGGWLVEPDA